MRRSPGGVARLLMVGLIAGACGEGSADAGSSFDAARPAPRLGTFGVGVPDSAFSSALWAPIDGSRPTAAAADIRIEIDVDGRTLHATRRGTPPWESPVAVGAPSSPTDRGQWAIRQVILNPADSEVRGRARLVADRRRAVEGTAESTSIGKAVSAGPIRTSNDAIVRLALLVMEAGGVARTDARVRRGVDDPTETVVVDLPRPVTIRVY